MVRLSLPEQEVPLAVVVDEALSPPTPQIKVNGVLLPSLARGMRRPTAEIKTLMCATARLQAFRDLRRELGPEWLPAHAEICAELQPRLLTPGTLLFRGLQSLQEPLLLIAGDAMMLASSPEQATWPNAQPAEVAVLQPGECLTMTSLTWLEPHTMTAVTRETLQLLVLPAAPFSEVVKLAQLRLLHRRTSALRALPLLSKCSEQGLRSLAHAGKSAVHPAGSSVIKQGGECAGLTLLFSGSATISKAFGAPAVGREDQLSMGVVSRKWHPRLHQNSSPSAARLSTSTHARSLLSAHHCCVHRCMRLSCSG